MKKIKTKAVQTDKNKTYCEICGTFSVEKRTNKCTNINHAKLNEFSRETRRIRLGG